jgi:hypothetical protein
MHRCPCGEAFRVSARSLNHRTRDVFGSVRGPSLNGIERDHADRIMKLPFQQIIDRGRSVAVFGVCLAIGGAKVSEVI